MNHTSHFSLIDSISIQIFCVINSLLPPARITKNSAIKKKFYTAIESWNAFVVVCRTEVEYKEMYDEKVKRESAIPPFISVIGSMDDPHYFMVDFENITYKLYSFAKAIDVCLKAYYIFNLAYPEACQHMWTFINRQFYQLADGEKGAKKTLELLNAIQCEYYILLFFIMLLVY